MADKILHKRNLSTGNIPTTASLDVGELAINVADGKLFLRQSGSIANKIITVGESASFAATASYVNPLNQNVQLTGSLNTRGGILIRDTSSNIVFDSVNKTLYDSSGITSINWASRTLHSSNLTQSINYDRRLATNKFGTVVIDWDKLQLLNSNEIIVVDWDSLSLNDINEVTSVDWSSRHLYNTNGDIVFDWENAIVTASLNGTASFASTASFAQSGNGIFTGSLFGTASWANNSISSSFSLSSSFATQALSSSFATTASFAPNYVLTSETSSMLQPYVLSSNTSSFITNSQTSSMSVATASHAVNGGVTQLLAGPNITLSPTNGKGQVTISSTGGGGPFFNTATGSYGSFYDTTTQTNPVGNIARSMSFNTTAITNGVSISGSTSPFNTYIKTENPGVYNIQFSAQVDKTDGGTDDIVIWLRKNGIDLTDTATTLTLPTNNSKVVAAWNWFVNSAANDYYQIIWLSADTDLRLLAETAGGGHPGIPSVILTANRVDQFLSNTGSFSGSFTGVFTGSLHGTSSWANNASTASYVNPLQQDVEITGSLVVTGSQINLTTDAFGVIQSNTLYLIAANSSIGVGINRVDGNTVADFESTMLYDSSTVYSIDWTNRQLIKSDGSTVALDWENGALTSSLYGTASWSENAISSSFSSTASFAPNYVLTSATSSMSVATASYVLNAVSSSFASTVPASGVIGLNLSQIATGSVTASVSPTQFSVTSGSSTELIVRGNGVSIGNTLTDIHTVTGSLSISGSQNITGSLTIAQNITSSRAFISSSTNTASGSTLTVYGSGSALPVFTVQGSQGELFSVTDSLSGSLFSVNEISGLPIIEVFSDSTLVMGNYVSPMLTTTARVTQTNSGSFVVYNIPTSSYDTVFFEYSTRSGSNARAGTIMAIQSGSSVNFTETTTTSFGTTSAISFGVFVTGSNIALTGSSTTGSWTTKCIIRGI